ncbi:hypothetical protein LSH36_1189g00014 [Paralvinella palmiformis]|uniref:Chitobiase C-terminal domain-containing protein n=1 Tax=Paralvinella palmiformis TaxID=53620 RepID=A0AAD9IUU5_9ANNE|nr:hypothetical protein LSH36_1189g00014 [Paralvinella palmiformis]
MRTGSTSATQSDREVSQTADWERFANTVGYKELIRLDRRNVQYAISPPGARIGANNTLEAMAEFPGQPIQWSDDGGQTWTDYSEDPLTNDVSVGL